MNFHISIALDPIILGQNYCSYYLHFQCPTIRIAYVDRSERFTAVATLVMLILRLLFDSVKCKGNDSSG